MLGTNKLARRLANRLRDRIAMMEGKRWAQSDFEASRESPPRPYSTEAAVLYWLSGFDDELDNGGGVIYGASAIARFMINKDGEIIFSKMHARSRADEARKLGFKVE